MRGDQLARQWRIVRTREASSNGLAIAEIAQREKTGTRTIYRDLEAFQEAGFPLYVEKANARSFIAPFKSKIPLPFALTELIALNSYRDLDCKAFDQAPIPAPIWPQGCRITKGIQSHLIRDSYGKSDIARPDPRPLESWIKVNILMRAGCCSFMDGLPIWVLLDGKLPSGRRLIGMIRKL